MGYYTIGILAGVSIVLVLGVFKKFQNRFIIQPDIVKLQITYNDKKEALEYIDSYFMRKGIKIKNIDFHFKNDCDDNFKSDVCLYTIEVPQTIKASNTISRLSRSSWIYSVEVVEN